MIFLRPLYCGAMLLVLGINAAFALPGTPHERAQIFATCSGRLSAMATRQRALHDPGARGTEEIRASFDMLLEATLPAALEFGVPDGMAFHWEMAGWREIAYLLADAQYSTDPGRSARASERMQARLDDCRSLILSGG